MKKYYALLIFIIFEYIRPGGFLPILSVLRVHTVLAILLFTLSIFSNKLISDEEVVSQKNTKLLAPLIVKRLRKSVVL